MADILAFHGFQVILLLSAPELREDLAQEAGENSGEFDWDIDLYDAQIAALELADDGCDELVGLELADGERDGPLKSEQELQLLLDED